MPESRSVLLHAVGDITLGDHPLCTGFGAHSRSRRRAPGFLFQHVTATLRRADLRFGNLECPISERGLRPGDYHSVQMRGHAAYLSGLVDTGFEVMNIATNHTMQHGPEPFAETVDLLRGGGVQPCGLDDGRGASIPASVVRHGLRIAFLGYSLRPRQYFTERPLYAEGNEAGIVADVQAARQQHDVVVVSLHWGDEFIQRPSPEDVRLAHRIIDSGCDLIIGHHPHVLRGVEQRGRGWIVYSLGNFVCDMLWSEELRETAICECRLTPEGVKDLRLIPARINDDCQPVPLEGDRASRLERKLQDLSQRLGAEASGDSSEYDGAALSAHRDQRAQSHRYFLKNAYRFPPRILAAQIVTYVTNRLAERGLTLRR